LVKGQAREVIGVGHQGLAGGEDGGCRRSPAYRYSPSWR